MPTGGRRTINKRTSLSTLAAAIAALVSGSAQATEPCDDFGECKELTTPKKMPCCTVADSKSTMKKTTSLILIAPLGAGLLYFNSPAPQSPDADRRPAILIRDDAAPHYLELALRDDDPRVRQAAIESLGDIGDSQSVNIISRALRDSDVEVRQRAVEVLDSLKDEDLFHALYPRS